MYTRIDCLEASEMQTSKSAGFLPKVNGADGSNYESNCLVQLPQIDFNYRGMKITIFKNGDIYDCGTTVVVSRHQFKHWIIFLDHLSKKLKLLAPVHKLFTTDGLVVRQFEALQNGGHYVAVSQGPFIAIEYGRAIVEGGNRDRRWNADPHCIKKDIGTLDSAESVDIYLRRCGYSSKTGLPFPWDEPKVTNTHPQSQVPSRIPVRGQPRCQTREGSDYSYASGYGSYGPGSGYCYGQVRARNDPRIQCTSSNMMLGVPLSKSCPKTLALERYSGATGVNWRDLDVDGQRNEPIVEEQTSDQLLIDDDQNRKDQQNDNNINDNETVSNIPKNPDKFTSLTRKSQPKNIPPAQPRIRYDPDFVDFDFFSGITF
ncbi:unnamed protein product [Anisakis simplex]|uniref:Doublecortin domain-containing protein n=1 Tax=Anisakis simplex TaxID=6269 RepID=A0A0M3JT37_ANISI|nr:unnamed protein product [Anisakis simplex]